MKKIYLFAILLVILASSGTARAVGVGVIVGEPTGLSLRFGNFPVMGIAWSLTHDHLHIHADYWIHNATLAAPVSWYLGAGVKAAIAGKDDSLVLGARLPIGLQWYPVQKLEIFGEIVPGVSVFPGFGFGLDGGIGLRVHL